MKSSTFSLFAIGFVLAAYGGMAFLEAADETRDQKLKRHAKMATAYCGNANWDIVAQGEKVSVTCYRRKPLNGSKVKP